MSRHGTRPLVIVGGYDDPSSGPGPRSDLYLASLAAQPLPALMQEHFGALSFNTLKAEIGKWGKITQTSKLANKLGVYWNRKDLLLMMGTDI